MPTVLFAFHDDDLLVRLPVEQVHITHNHPLSDTAVDCVAFMLAHLLRGGDQVGLPCRLPWTGCCVRHASAITSRSELQGQRQNATLAFTLTCPERP